MSRRQIFNTLIVLLTLIAAISLMRLLWGILASFRDLILQFGLAWLLAFILRPLANWLSEGPLARKLIAAIQRRWGPKRAQLVRRVLDPLVVTLIYLGLLGLLIVALVALIPVIFSQARQFGANLGTYIDQTTAWLLATQARIADRFNVSPDTLYQFYRPEELNRRLAGLVDIAPRFLGSLIRGVASGVGEALLVLALSYYLMLDSRRLSRQIYDLIPKRYHEQYEFASDTIGRTFGGFVRGQFIMALLSGVVTGLAATAAGLHSAIIVGVLSGFVIFIPLIGAPIAMFLPAIVALIQGLPLVTVLLLFGFLTLFQQVLLHFVVPRIMSESVGMPSLLILLSTLVGVRLWGIWGFIFGIPVAGAIYSVGLVMLKRLKRAQDRLDAQERHREQPAD